MDRLGARRIARVAFGQLDLARGEEGADTVLAQPSIASEERGNLSEPSRFGTLARRVFQPLLSVEDLR